MPSRNGSLLCIASCRLGCMRSSDDVLPGDPLYGVVRTARVAVTYGCSSHVHADARAAADVRRPGSPVDARGIDADLVAAMSVAVAQLRYRVDPAGECRASDAAPFPAGGCHECCVHASSDGCAGGVCVGRVVCRGWCRGAGCGQWRHTVAVLTQGAERAVVAQAGCASTGATVDGFGTRGAGCARDQRALWADLDGECDDER